jgi:hypothetical protein
VSLFNLSAFYHRMRNERDNAVGEEQLLRDLIADHFVDQSPAALEWLQEIAAEHRKAGASS